MSRKHLDKLAGRCVAEMAVTLSSVMETQYASDNNSRCCLDVALLSTQHVLS